MVRKEYGEGYKEYLRDYGLDFDPCVKNVHDFIGRLIRSGIDPADVSLEGYRYAETVVKTAIPAFSEKRHKQIAAALLEEAAIQAGISTDQLMAVRLEHSTKAEG